MGGGQFKQVWGSIEKYMLNMLAKVWGGGKQSKKVWGLYIKLHS